MSYVRFRANIPEEFSLKYPEGKEVESKFAGGAKQTMFTLEDGRKAYLYPSVAATINTLGIRKGERLSICKRVVIDAGKPKIQWEVKRIVPTPPEAGTAPPTTPNGATNGKTKPELMNELGLVLKNAGQDVPPPADPDDPGYASNGNRQSSKSTPSEQAPVTEHGPFYLERSCLLIDVVAAAHKYAVETYNGTFTKEDVRSLVLSVFIQNGKSMGGR
jgi:hypothetical protein